MRTQTAKSGLALLGTVGLGSLGGLALASTVFVEDFSAPTLSAYVPGCERQDVSGESCASNLDSAVYVSSPQSAHLSGHGSCFVPPYSGVASTLSRTIPLANGGYILSYKARHTTQLYNFCTGATGGETKVSANGVSPAGVGCSVGGSCSTCTADWDSRTVCFPVTAGSAKLKILTDGGDCANVNGWVDDIKIETEAPVFDASSLAPQILVGSCAGGPLTFSMPTAQSQCGGVSVSCSSLSADSFGANTLTCTATDSVGGTSTTTLTVNVLEPLRVAFAPPLSDDNVADDVRTDADVANTFHADRTVPQKVKLFNCSNADVTTTALVAVKLAVAAGATGVSDGGTNLISSAADISGVGGADGSMVLTDGQYQLNLKTSAAKYPAGQEFQSLVTVSYTAEPGIIVGQEDARLVSM